MEAAIRMHSLSVYLLTGALLGSAAMPAGDGPADGELMRQVADGNTRAFETLYDRYAPAVFSLLLRMMRDRGRAEDLTQEVFLALWRNAGSFDTAVMSALPWLFVVARRRALDLLRSATSRREFGVDAALLETAPAAVNAEARLLEAHTLDRIHSAFAVLTPDERLVLELAYFEGCTQSEISTKTGAPLGTVKTWTRSGLAKLREVLP